MLRKLYCELNMKFVNEYNILSEKEKSKLYNRIYRIRAILSYCSNNEIWIA